MDSNTTVVIKPASCRMWESAIANIGVIATALMIGSINCFAITTTYSYLQL